MSRLGDAIHGARLKAKMSEKQLGRKCGMSEGVIREIEAGKRIVSDDQAQRILRILGSESPVSTELDVAAEPEVKLRPRPRAYILKPEGEENPKASDEATDAWLDALGGVVKRVPVMDAKGIVIDHVLTPIVGGRIEGGAPDKVLYFRMPDDALRGFRIYAGDLLLVVPETHVVDNTPMLIELKGEKCVRRLCKAAGLHVQIQSYDREFESLVLPQPELRVLGRCVRLVRSL